MSSHPKKEEEDKYSRKPREYEICPAVFKCGKVIQTALVARKRVDETSVELKKALALLGFANFKQMKDFLDGEAGLHGDPSVEMKKMLAAYRATLTTCVGIFNSIALDWPMPDDKKEAQLCKTRKLSRANLDVYYANNLPGETYTKEDKQERADGIMCGCLEILTSLEEYEKLINSGNPAHIIQHSGSLRSFLQQCDELFTMCTTDLLHRGVVLCEKETGLPIGKHEPKIAQVSETELTEGDPKWEEGDPRWETIKKKADK